LLVQAIVIFGLIAIGMILGGYVVWTRYRHLPSNERLRFANYIYQKKSEDYKALCMDARSQAEALVLLASSIHQNNPSEASAKIVSALDHFITVMNERLSAKQFTPASSELGSEQ
jgi:hypothetical protein